MAEAEQVWLAGGAQATHRDPDPAAAPDPVEALAGVARAAAEDAGGGAALLEALDAVALVGPMGWSPRNGPRLVCERLGISPAREIHAATGGESALALTNHLAFPTVDGAYGTGVLRHVDRGFRLRT